MLKTLIMAGGKGTRFWPVSTEQNPKQYTKLFSDQSLLQATLSRLSKVSQKDEIYIVTVENQLALAKEQGASFMAENNIILEPEGRNTAPCIFYGLLRLLHDGHSPDSVVAVLPSDHVILDEAGFADTLDTAAKIARGSNKLVTIGIKPNIPHTGYGYIEKGSPIGDGHIVLSFKEKPNQETAREYINTGNFLWNAGMFIAPISLLLQEFEQHAPVYSQFKDELMNSLNTNKGLKAVYTKLPKDSIDYAVLEKSKNVAVVEAKFDWNDLGSWDALEDVVEKHNENVIAASEAFRQIDSNDNIIFAPGKKVSLIGVDNLVIVSHGDEIMVLPKSSAQRVKELSAKDS